MNRGGIIVLLVVLAGLVWGLVWTYPKWSSYMPEIDIFSPGNTGETSSGTPTINYGSGTPLVKEYLPADFTPVVEAVAPAVVRIETEKIVGYDWWLRPIPETGLGTGVIFSSEGDVAYIVTNKHVVEGVNTITVYLNDGTRFTVNNRDVVLARDTDLALLKIRGAGDVAAVRFLNPDQEVQPYQWVIAIGYPYGIGGSPTVSQGIVSAVGRSIEVNGSRLENIIQTDAAINPGNSGGPLVNLAGELVGINTAILKGAENIGFAIDIRTVEQFIQRARKAGYL